MPVNLRNNLLNDADIIQTLTALGQNVRLVGGCVRDAVLGIGIKDIDMATPYKPQETMRLLKENNIKAIPTGIEHGTVTAVINGRNFEITTLRSDVACDGRHAEVKFTYNWQEDAARRDFTINAMSCDAEGVVHDYFGGIADLENGLVRFVGNANERCAEDYLRILRFFRFNAYYGHGGLENAGIVACRNNAAGLKNLSGERIQSEMLKLLAAKNPYKIIKAMQENNILAHVIPFEANIENLQNIEIAKGCGLLRLAALCKSDSVTREDVAKLSARWKLSNKDKKYLNDVLFEHGVVAENISEKELQKLIRKNGADLFFDIAVLSYAFLNGDWAKYEQMINYAKGWQIPQFNISGDDLIKIGIAPGKILGNLLKDAEKWWEDNNYSPSDDEIIEYIKKQSGII